MPPKKSTDKLKTKKPTSAEDEETKEEIKQEETGTTSPSKKVKKESQ